MEQVVTRTPLEVLFSISRELATTLDLHKVLARVLILSTENIGAERASLVVLDESGKPSDAAIIYDGKLSPHTVEQMQDVVAYGLAGWVVKNKKPALLANTHKDDRWLVRPDEVGKKDPAKSALCVPLMARDQLVGVLTIVHPKVDFFSDQQFKLQQAIADLAGIAIRNAQLYEDVQAAHHRYRDLFNDSIDPIFITSLDGKIQEGNQQAIFSTGNEQSKLSKMDIRDLHEIPEDKVSKVLDLARTTDALIYESFLKCVNCDQLPVEVHVSAITIQGRQYLQWIFRNISERKNLDALREDLAAMIYHDLRSPLANIISSLEIMQSLLPFDQAASLKQIFDIATRSTERMQRLISSLLDINRLEAGQQITDKQNVDVTQLITEAVEMIQPIVRSKELDVEKLIPGKIPPLYVDGDMIRRVLINLLENSAKFSPQKSRISVGAKLNGDRITIWVEDHGPGIPPEQRERIFDKFVRLHGDGMSKGLGLGLAFCRIAVQSHGGTIWVESVTEGGSRFIFTLPAAL
jgi:two-component system, NtrC family, sensor histidine kinase KinB